MNWIGFLCCFLGFLSLVVLAFPHIILLSSKSFRSMSKNIASNPPHRTHCLPLIPLPVSPSPAPTPAHTTFAPLHSQPVWLCAPDTGSPLTLHASEGVTSSWHAHTAQPAPWLDRACNLSRAALSAHHLTLTQTLSSLHLRSSHCAPGTNPIGGGALGPRPVLTSH